MRSYSITHPPGVVGLPTQPGWDQLVFAESGSFSARTRTQAWTIPAHRALCVPDGMRVVIETTRRCPIRCLYAEVGLGVFGRDLRVIGLGSLVRELLAHAIDVAPTDLTAPADEALITLLSAQLADEPDAPLHLPLPIDPAAHGVAAVIMSDPASRLEAALHAAGAGRRTIERRFRDETGLSLGQWRRRARVLAGVAMLADGESVTQVAVATGYSTPSAFVAAFRAELDAPPLAFMRRTSGEGVDRAR